MPTFSTRFFKINIYGSMTFRTAFQAIFLNAIFEKYGEKCWSYLHYNVWCVNYNVWCVNHNVWCVNYNVWCVNYNVWCVNYNVLRVNYNVSLFTSLLINFHTNFHTNFVFLSAFLCRSKYLITKYSIWRKLISLKIRCTQQNWLYTIV